MNLDESQRKKVAEWVTQGLKLAEIQTRLQSDLGLRLTYMEVRLLVDDLKLTLKDIEPPKAPPSPLTSGPTPKPAATPAANPGQPAQPPAPAGQVAVTVDQLTRPGAVVSGKVTFRDGQKAEWYLDQTGRLGLAPQQPNYRPPAADVQEFQIALENELARMGL